MLKTRIDQDTLHQASGSRLEQVRVTKKECERTCKALPNYLKGHLFRHQARRIDRHLKVCPVCTSELLSLRHAADTQQLLKDLTPAEGMAAGLGSVGAFFGKLRLLLYRPLWMLLLAVIAGYVYFFVIVPLHHDPELESIERSLPAASDSAPAASPAARNPAPAAVTAPAPFTAPVPTTAAAKKPPVPAAPAAEPLAITITPDDQSSMKRINEIMKGHAGLRKLRFTDTVREVSGSLTTSELLTLFGRIEQAGKVSYSRKRFNALSTTEMVPFTMKLKDAPAVPGKPAAAATAKSPAPAPAPAPAAASPQPVATSPTSSAQP